MRRGRIITAVTAFAAAVAVGAPGALAATPQQIYKDYADNGRLDGHYTRGQINRALHAPSLQGYERTGAPAPTPGITSSDPPGPGSARGALPFGGLDLALFGGVGGPLLILGASLGRLARVRARD